MFQNDIISYGTMYMAEKQSLFYKELKDVLNRMRDTGLFECIRGRYILKIDNNALRGIVTEGQDNILGLDHFKIIFSIHAAVVAFSILIFGLELIVKKNVQKQ